MNEPEPTPIPVVCTRCSASGTAGSGHFDHLSGLTDFTPVEQKVKRVDGWTPARQRDFILALSATGSKRRAAAAIGMAAFGIDQLLRKPGSESFALAYERAMAIAERSDASARAATLDHIKKKLPLPSAGEGWGEGADESEIADNLELKLEVIERLGLKFFAKVQAERDARLAGQIVAADFYLRQITALEVAFDLMAHDCGYTGFHLLSNIRRAGHNLYAIAETPFSRMLDDERRKMWAGEDDDEDEDEDEPGPERPEHPPQRFLEHHADPVSGEGYSLEPLEALGPASRPPVGVDPEEWAAMGYDAQKLVREEQHRRDAEAQVAWESRAAAEHNEQARSAT